MSTTRRAPCPKCDRGPRDASLAITTDERGTVEFCHRCHYTRANNHTTAAGIVPAPRIYREWAGLADSIWTSARPLRGTLAERYLQSRRCAIPPAITDLRFLPVTRKYPAAMVARVVHAATGKPMTLHFTELDSSGRKIGRRLLSGHPKKGGIIRLYPLAASRDLGIAEGIETALSVPRSIAPIWSTVDAGNLAAFPVLGSVDHLHVYADHDAAGLDAVRQCAYRWRAAGKHVQVFTPQQPGHDFNDEINRTRKDAAA